MSEFFVDKSANNKDSKIFLSVHNISHMLSQEEALELGATLIGAALIPEVGTKTVESFNFVAPWSYKCTITATLEKR